MAVSTNFLKRLIKEDFDAKDQTLVGKLAFILNPAILQIIAILQHGLKLTDLNAQDKVLTVVVDNNGVPVNPISFESTLSGNCSKIHVGRVQNTTNTATYPTSGVLISFSEVSGQIKVTHITGLTAGDSWQITLTAFV